MSGNAKFRLVLLAFSCAVIFLATLSGCARTSYDRGTSLAMNGKYEESISHFKAAIRNDPVDYESHGNLGMVYYELGRYQEAIASLNTAIRINPNYELPYFNLGLVYQSQGRYQEAIASYKESIQIKGDGAAARRSRNNINNLEQKIAQGNTSSQVTQHLDPYNQGTKLLESGDYSSAIDYLKEATRLEPNYAYAHHNLGVSYGHLGRYQEAIASFKEAIRIDPNNAASYGSLGWNFNELGLYQEAIAPLKEAIRIDPNNAASYGSLGFSYFMLGRYDEAIAFYREVIRINPNDPNGNYALGNTYGKLGRHQEAIASFKEAIRLNPNNAFSHNNLGWAYELLGRNDEAITEYKEAVRIDPKDTNAQNNLKNLEQKIAQARSSAVVGKPKSQPSEGQSGQSGTGSGFFVSKLGHVITNAHVVKGCNKVTVGDNANKQVPAEVVNTDRSNDLALLKLSTFEFASSESKSLIQKLSIAVIPLASKGLLRSEDVRLGEKVLVAGFPFGDFFSNSIKVTTGIVSSTRGAGDDSGQFQLDAAIQPGNSGGPIYDSSGSIVGVVISQLNKLKMIEVIGALPENVNFGIKASTVRQFLVSSGLPSKKSELTEDKSTEQLAQIAKNQALMVKCFQ
jgi:tetratricopeptide (TPR) repeat protein/V8-like Glu-specific endopeptidase